MEQAAAGAGMAWLSVPRQCPLLPMAPTEATYHSLVLPSVSVGPGPSWGAPWAQDLCVVADGCMRVGEMLCKLVRLVQTSGVHEVCASWGGGCRLMGCKWAGGVQVGLVG